jgi:hypothetical protein
MSRWRSFLAELDKKQMAGPVVLLMLAIILSIFGVVVTRCCLVRGSPDPVSFEAICGLTHEEMVTMDEEQVLQWITAHYGVPIEEIQRGGYPPSEYRWADDHLRGYAELTGGQLQSIKIEYYRHNGPTFCQVVDRLGPPETVLGNYYQAIAGAIQTVVLEYPQQGLSLITHINATWFDTWVDLKPTLRVDAVYCFPPDCGEEGACEAFHGFVGKRVPWPGFWAEVYCEP